MLSRSQGGGVQGRQNSFYIHKNSSLVRTTFGRLGSCRRLNQSYRAWSSFTYPFNYTGSSLPTQIDSEPISSCPSQTRHSFNLWANVSLCAWIRKWADQSFRRHRRRKCGLSHKKTKLGSETLRYQYARSFYYVLPVVNSELHFDFEVSDCHIMVRLHEGPRGEREIPTELVL